MKFWATAFVLPAVFTMALTQETEQQPVESGLVEQTERRLMQIDVTVRGPASTVSALTRRDFRLTVGRKDIDNFVLDRVCIDGGVEGLDISNPEVTSSLPRLRTLIYFDQTHLTSFGRQRSMELARELIPGLLESGRSEVMIVSASHRLKVASGWSADPAVLLVALDELATDPQQVSFWADREDTRVEQLMGAIERMAELIRETRRESHRRERSGNPVFESGTAMAMESARTMARLAARDLSREEAGRTARGLDLFSVALQYLDEFTPPKAVVYFADTMRANAGDFYIDLVQSFDHLGKLGSAAGARKTETVILSSGNYVREFQQAIEVATEKGVRFYTVQGRGLAPQPFVRPRADSAALSSGTPLAGRARFEDAENALSGFARETGGKSFLGAADATMIASQILDDLSCLFVLSFHPIDLKEDRPTAVWIDVDQPGVELKYRPKVLALGNAARKRERLASAFWTGDRSRDSARVTAVPTGFKGGKYTVLIQFAIPGFEFSGSDWDMGLTAVVGRNRTIKSSGRVAVNQPGRPLVFEAEMHFKPGDFTITAVAKDHDHDQLISTRVNGSLPHPDDAEPFVASIVMLQRIPGAFIRGETSRTSGPLAQGSAHWLRPDRPTGILTLVCGNKHAEAVTTGRRLKGASEVSFDPVELDFAEERCGLLVDTIHGNILTSGRFTYTVDLKRGPESIAESKREFLVVSQDEIALIGNEAGGRGD